MNEETVLQKDVRYIVGDVRKALAGLDVIAEEHWKELGPEDWNEVRTAMDAMYSAIAVLKKYRKPTPRRRPGAAVPAGPAPATLREWLTSLPSAALLETSHCSGDCGQPHAPAWMLRESSQALLDQPITAVLDTGVVVRNPHYSEDVTIRAVPEQRAPENASEEES
jgi:hypothetical protein